MVRVRTVLAILPKRDRSCVMLLSLAMLAVCLTAKCAGELLGNVGRNVASRFLASQPAYKPDVTLDGKVTFQYFTSPDSKMEGNYIPAHPTNGREQGFDRAPVRAPPSTRSAGVHYNGRQQWHWF